MQLREAKRMTLRLEAAMVGGRWVVVARSSSSEARFSLVVAYACNCTILSKHINVLYLSLRHRIGNVSKSTAYVQGVMKSGGGPGVQKASPDRQLGKGEWLGIGWVI